MKSRKQQEARALRLVTGLRMNWIDDAGLDEEPRVRDHVVGHRKPLLRPDAKAIWRDFYDWITHHPTLLWRIDVGVIFDDGVIDSQRVVERVDLKLLAHACQPAIRGF